jgi:hypothetical protein
MSDLHKLYEGWAEEFLKCKGVPMSETLSKAFISLTMREMQTVSEDIPEIHEQLGYKILDSRATAIGLELTQNVKYLLTMLCDRPGTIVMYAYALRYAQVSRELEKITMQQIANLFPMGFLNNDDLHTMWDLQKVEELKGANMLDRLGG